MKTHELIDSLSVNLTPVKRLPSVGYRFATWFAGAFFLVVLGALFLGPRPDLASILPTSTFVLDASVALVVALVAGLSAFYLSVPGAEASKRMVLFTSLAVFGWVGLFVFHYFFSESVAPIGTILAQKVPCPYQVIGLSLIPGILLFGALKRGAPLKFGLSGVLAWLSVGSLGALAVQFLCPGKDIFHIAIWHLGPVVVLSLAGYFLGSQLLKWWRASG